MNDTYHEAEQAGENGGYRPSWVPGIWVKVTDRETQPETHRIVCMVSQNYNLVCGQWTNEWMVFQATIQQCKAILGRGKPFIMKWILVWIMSQMQDWSLTWWPAVHLVITMPWLPTWYKDKIWMTIWQYLVLIYKHYFSIPSIHTVASLHHSLCFFWGVFRTPTAGNIFFFRINLFYVVWREERSLC